MLGPLKIVLTEWSESHGSLWGGLLRGVGSGAWESAICQACYACHAVYTGLTSVGRALHQSNSLPFNFALN